MPNVVVDHTGKSGSHYFTKDVPVELPADVVAALGDAAQPAESASQAKREAVQKKEVKKVQNKMVQKADTTTKEPEAPKGEDGAEEK